MIFWLFSHDNIKIHKVYIIYFISSYRAHIPQLHTFTSQWISSISLSIDVYRLPRHLFKKDFRKNTRILNRRLTHIKIYHSHLLFDLFNMYIIHMYKEISINFFYIEKCKFELINMVLRKTLKYEIKVGGFDCLF